MRAAKGRVVLAALLAVGAGVPATADHLVTRDGQVIETRGQWEIRGKLLVFRLADGTLASMRLEEADLEASEEWNRAAAQRRLEAREDSLQPPPEPVEASFVITDRDVVHILDLGEELGTSGGADAGGGDPATGAGGADGTTDVEAASTGGVQVVQWSQEPEGETGVAVRGVIENLGASFATGVSLNALFYDAAGDLIAARDVQLENSPLGPGEQREFVVSLPDTLIYDEIKFLVVARGFRSVGQNVRAVAYRSQTDVQTP